MEKYIKDAIEYLRGYDCEATKAFIEAHESFHGDSVDAFKEFQNSAEKIKFGEEYLLMFRDNSCYCSWKDIEDAFYLDVGDLCIEDIAIKDFLENMKV